MNRVATSLVGTLVLSACEPPVPVLVEPGTPSYWVGAEQYVPVDLGDLGGGAHSRANAINAEGMVVGISSTPTGQHAFLWPDPVTGDMVDLGTLGGATSEAFGINAAGQVVGHSQTASGQFRPFLWEGGSMIALLEAPGLAAAINDFGEVAGWTIGGAYVLSGGSLTHVGLAEEWFRWRWR